MAKPTHTEMLGQMIELLTPLSSEERQRMVRASMTFLGEPSVVAARLSEEGSGIDDSAGELVLPPRVRMWRKQNGLTDGQLQQVFSFADEKVEVIASEIPGASTKERTVNAYVLAGLAKYLASGEPKFDDKSARAVCSDSGSYDSTNHSTYLKGKGNLFNGSKDAGWALTAPGLKHAADLVKRLAE